MKSRTVFMVVCSCAMVLIFAQLQGAVRRKPAQGPNEPLARMNLSPTTVWFEPLVPYSAVSLSFSGPDGVVHEQIFTADQTAHISVPVGAADGIYKYELRIISGKTRVRDEIEAAPAPGFSEPSLVQTGSFRVFEGSVASQSVRSEEGIALDIVQADDVIVQGSLGVGLDSVSGQNFGFSTILLKEDNTRITFDDTSTLAGFPNNDWQLTANGSAGGGLSYFAIEDLTGAKVPFLVVAGATTNSLYVDSTGRIGLRTSTPVLDLHVKTSNTPGFRLEQDNSGGFTAQTWDIAGNESNFFVRDVTGGSRLPFRIRPGAPTSSLDISAAGNVGIGLGSPERMLHLRGSNAVFRMDRSADTAAFVLVRTAADFTPWKTYVIGTNATGVSQGEFIINDLGNGVGGVGARRMTITNEGNVQFTGNVSAPSFTQTSSLVFKTNVRTYENALDTVNRLRGVRFDWRDTGKTSVGLIAEEVDQVIPEVVAHDGGKASGVNYANLVAVLVEAVKEQQKTIERLEPLEKAYREQQARIERLERLLDQRQP